MRQWWEDIGGQRRGSFGISGRGRRASGSDLLNRHCGEETIRNTCSAGPSENEEGARGDCAGRQEQYQYVQYCAVLGYIDSLLSGV